MNDEQSINDEPCEHLWNPVYDKDDGELIGLSCLGCGATRMFVSNAALEQRITKLEAQVRTQAEALRLAQTALEWFAGDPDEIVSDRDAQGHTYYAPRRWCDSRELAQAALAAMERKL